MARIAGVEIPDKAKVDWALTLIKGVGWSRSVQVLTELKINPKRVVSDLSSDELSKIVSKLEKFNIEGDLVREVRENIQRIKEIKTYKGLRHGQGLPIRGQRTRSNARTRRGKRKTVGSFRKEAMAKAPSA